MRSLCRDQKERGKDSASGRELHGLCDRVPGPETIPGPPAWREDGGSALGGAPQEGGSQQGGRRAPEGGEGLGTHWKLGPVLGSVLIPFSLPEP